MIFSLWLTSQDNMASDSSSTPMDTPKIYKMIGQLPTAALSGFWIRSKSRISRKCSCFVYFNPTDVSLATGLKEHKHPFDPLVEEKKELSEAKAEDRKLSSTVNTEHHDIDRDASFFCSCLEHHHSPYLNCLARGTQRARLFQLKFPDLLITQKPPPAPSLNYLQPARRLRKTRTP